MSGSDLKLRFISGGIAFAVVLPILLFGGFWWVAALAFTAACWGLHEIVSMGMPGQRATAFPLIVLLGALFFGVGAFSTSGGIPGLGETLPGLSTPLLVVLVVSSSGRAHSGRWARQSCVCGLL